MDVKSRAYKAGDVEKIGEFYGRAKVNNYRTNSLKCAWDCFSKHPCFPEFRPEEFGLWEANGEIVGVVRLQSPWNGVVYIDLYPQYKEIYSEMIEYAEEHFSAYNDSGKKHLTVCVQTVNKDLQEALLNADYEKAETAYISAFPLIDPIPDYTLPEGFQIRPLSEVYDFDKLNALLWKAFNYAGDPPAYDADVKLSIMHAWLDYRRDICMAAIAPDGSFASFCGMWLDELGNEAYLEPLATLKEYRNLGLGKACVYSALKKCREYGAEYAYVEPDERAAGFYKHIGFTSKIRGENSWKKWVT